MKNYIPFIFILFFLLTSCIRNTEPEFIPENYPDGSFSVQGFLNVKSQYENQDVVIKGIIIDVYNCPSCPPLAHCKPCAPPHLSLADHAEETSSKSIIIVNLKNNPRSNFKIGEKVTLSLKYSSYNPGGVANQNGYFVYDASANP